MQYIENVVVKNHNGQCSYGEWMPATDATMVNPDVANAIADEICVSGESHGQINVGGCQYIYREMTADEEIANMTDAERARV